MAQPRFDFQKGLEGVSNEILLEFLHACINDVNGKKQHVLYDNFKSCTNWSRDEYNAACQSLKQLLCNIVTNNTPQNVIAEQYPELNSDHLQCIYDCLQVRRDDIKETILNSSGVSGPLLQDFDWKLKWVIGSSSLSSIREPLLHLNFNVLEKKNSVSDNSCVNVEMNSSELKTLLTTLEKAEESIRNWDS